MCGITGFITKDENKEELVCQMMKRLNHRGPDGEGIFIDDIIALGHKRLSIIDLNTGSQPMFNENERYVVIFNGEIYNYLELKAELEKKDHYFKTSSDTEVLLHGYEEWGYLLLEKLRGMFAFVIWDREKQELFGARDQFGIKPFYYYYDDKAFMFASEIKAFLDHPSFKKEFNKDILIPYLSFNYSPTSETFFKNVRKLEPGNFFVYKEQKLIIKRYFKLRFKEEEHSKEYFIDKVAEVMEDSVNKHMLSDVEVGSFLSSGVDSSYLVCLAKPDKTYTVGYKIDKYNEIAYAEDLANRLNINNTSKIITKEEYFKEIPKIMYHMDEPLADPAAVSLYFVSKLASKDVKVVLSGEGADELFGGYNYYREEIDYKFYNKIPYFIRKFISLCCSLLPEVRGINFLVRRGQKLEDNYIGVTKVFSERERKRIVNFKDNKLKNKDITKWVYDEQKKENNVIKMQAIDINFWLIKDILQKADKMTMASSIEGRVPFTDVEVFNIARTLPLDLKVSAETTKVALREAAKKVIPNESYKKKKLGFPVPLREWMKDENIYNLISEAFDSEISLELFNNKRIHKLLDKASNPKNKDKYCYKKVWTIYCFIIWYQQFFT